jgi:hypothetical protein
LAGGVAVCARAKPDTAKADNTKPSLNLRPMNLPFIAIFANTASEKLFPDAAYSVKRPMAIPLARLVL